ncbi:MAG TPA: hypothetical protein VM204_09150 [Gaiellaceae bacterium]|nr:hypothetical protein [Gaiellaceae bacterium]
MLIAVALAALASASFIGGFLFHAVLVERLHHEPLALDLDLTAAAARGELDLREPR